MRFVHNAEDVFCGLSGVGKSHLAIALGVKVGEVRTSVYLTSSGNFIERLKSANNEGMFEKKLKGLMKFKVLIYQSASSISTFYYLFVTIIIHEQS